MNGRPRVRRSAVAGVAVVLAGALAAGTAVPPSANASPAPAPGGGQTRPAGPPELPPLDPALFRKAIDGLPNDTATAAVVGVTGRAGRWSGESGVADLRTHKPVSRHGRFRIGSITKVFTAVVALQLAAEHRLDLDRSVQDYLPGLLPASYPPIAVGQLLDHTGGLPLSRVDERQQDPAYFVAHRFEGWTPEEVVASATTAPMEFRPGTRQQYNGVNYFLAGMVIEKVAGHAYADEVARRIVRPLRLRDTYVPAGNDPRIRGRHTHGYVSVDGTPRDVSAQSPWSWAEGGMVSTTGDLGRLLTAVFRGDLLPRDQVARMFRVPDVPYVGANGGCAVGPDAGRACFSMGLQRTTFPNGVTVWGKSGSVPGYTSAVFATRDLRRMLVFNLTPTGNRDGSEGPYVQGLAGAAFDPSLTAP